MTGRGSASPGTVLPISSITLWLAGREVTPVRQPLAMRGTLGFTRIGAGVVRQMRALKDAILYAAKAAACCSQDTQPAVTDYQCVARAASRTGPPNCCL